MNKRPELEELFEAARRREADIRRRQKLTEMISQLAADEAPRRKRPIWTAVGIAASILLLVNVGRHFLYNGDYAPSQQGQLVAKNQPTTVVANDSSEVPDTLVGTAVQPVKMHREPTLLADNGVKKEEPTAELLQEEVESEEAVLPVSDILDAEPLLAEETAAQTETKSNGTKVHERTSTRLVCGAGCNPQPKGSEDSDAPQYAFLNISGTGTSVELGSIAF